MDWRDEIRARFPDWGTDSASARWPAIRDKLPIGQEVRGEVIALAPFGVWVDIAVGHPALLLVPEMAGARERRITFEDYPALLTAVEARIVCLGNRGEISLSQYGQTTSL
jgi:ribosomal protein S1